MITLNNKIISLFVISFLLLSLSVLRDLQNSFPTEHGVYTNEIQDEYHTLILGTNELLGMDNDVNRVGSFSRLIVKALSPIGVFYMNNNMGGEHHVTTENMHDYAGYSYLERNFESSDDILRDPNIQNYRFGILLARNILFILILLSTSYLLFKDNLRISSLFFLFSTLSSSAYLKAKSVLYTDFSTLFILYLFFLCYLSKSLKLPIRNYIALILIISLISNGLSNLVLVPIIFTITSFEKKNYYIKYFIFFLSVFYIFNFNELADPINYLDNQLWNLYHYQTGHYMIEPVGLPMLKKIFLYSFPWIGSILLLFAYKYINNNDKILFIILSISQIIIILTSSQLRVFVDRNYAGLIVYGIFICTLFIKSLEEKITPVFLQNNLMYFIVLALFIVNPLIQNNNFNYRIESAIEKVGCENTLIVNEKDYNFKLQNYDFKNITISQTVPAPEYFSDLEMLISKYDCLIIKHTFESKNLATFVSPKTFNLATRTNEYYFYYK